MYFKSIFQIIFIALLFSNCTKEKLGSKLMLVEKIQLDSVVNECSGIAFYDKKLWTVNDSGGGNVLYEINEDGRIINKHEIDFAVNKDWENLTTDDEYVYIADIGNNFGDRKDLKIYQLNNDLSLNQEISIVYNDQIDFNNRLEHNFDAESSIIYKGNLWVFTKNHQNDSCNVYTKSLNTNSELFKINTITTNGLVTDAYFEISSQKLYLLIYNYSGNEFICHLDIYQGLESNTLTLLDSFLLPINEQAEALTKIDDNEFLIGTEREGINIGGHLYRIRIED